ncbi:MAG: transposase [Janthinobacterium lividum]
MRCRASRPAEHQGCACGTLVAAIGNGISFRKGRDLASWLRLVPRQHSTGGKTRLLGISKIGNEYLRRMMLHGARSVVMQMERKPSALGEWLTSLSARRHCKRNGRRFGEQDGTHYMAILTKGIHYSAPAFVAA